MIAPRPESGSPAARALGQSLSRTNGFADLGELRGIHQAQVSDLDQPLRVEPQVLGLDVTVNHALVVGMPEPACRLQDVAGGFLGYKPFLLADQHTQVLPFNVLGAEIGRALGLAEIIDLSQVVMTKLSRCISLAREPGHERRVPGPQELHDLQVHVAVEPQRPCEIHWPQDAPAKLAQDKISAEQTGNRSATQTTPREGTRRNGGSRVFIAGTCGGLSGSRQSRRRSARVGERQSRAIRGFRFDLAREIRRGHDGACSACEERVTCRSRSAGIVAAIGCC